VTVFLRDMSHFDSTESLTGFIGTTHKVTEGTSFVDPTYAGRLNRFHAAGVPVLGAYHVLHTGSLAAQLDHWLSTLDALTPWWRTHPHFILQIDAEKWPNDPVTGPLHQLAAPLPLDEYRRVWGARISTTETFAQMLVDSGAPGFKVTYASRGQFGDSLAGIAVPLWNAAYHSSTYPGDGAVDWAPYSGRTPVLWQYTSTPFDKSAFRGSADELLALISGDDMANADDVLASVQGLRAWIANYLNDKNGTAYPVNATLHQILAAATAPGSVALSDADRAALVAALPSAADVAAHLDYDKLAAALATHFHVA